MIRAITRLKAEPWAIEQAVMQTIIEIAERENGSPQAVAEKLGRPLENTYNVETRDGVAILPVMGPLFRHASLFNDISGATSYDRLARDFRAALDNPAVRSIVLHVDSPGGEVNGTSEFADQIFAARGRKPVTAYVGGSASSAAYWIASAADEIVISDTAQLGSIGAVVSVQDTSARDEKAGVRRIEIVSSQSPHKRIDLNTEDGRGRLQARLDAFADVFVAKVARNRDVTTDKVLEEFGGGDVFVGAAAVSAGLADRVGSLEQVIAELSTGSFGIRTPAFSASAEGNITEETAMSGEKQTLTAAQVVEQNPQAVDEIRAEARTAERNRVNAILGSPEATDRTDLARHLALETDTTPEAANKILAASAKVVAAAAAPKVDALAAAMANVPNADVGANADTNGGTEADPVAACIETAKAMSLA
jgi:signal peptide peptidase SppA